MPNRHQPRDGQRPSGPAEGRTRRGTRAWKAFAAAALLASSLVPAAPASAYDVELAWTRISDVDGYKVYIQYNSQTQVTPTDHDGDPAQNLTDGFGWDGRSHSVNTIYTRPIRVAPLQAGAGGLIRFTVTGLPLGPTVQFNITAERDGVESKFSNRIRVNYSDVAAVIDSDKDGLTDAEEDTNLNGKQDQGETDQYNGDSDSDGLSDGDEVLLNGTDPLNEDSDDDGIVDGLDTCHDVDNDGYGAPGILDLTCPVDNCLFKANPDQADLDADLLGDVCDPCTNLVGDQNLTGKASLVLAKINTDPVEGNEVLTVGGDFFLPGHRSFADLDPMREGGRVMLRGADGTILTDIELPAAPYPGGKKGRGWRISGRPRTWKYLDKTPTPENGIVLIVAKDMSKREPNMVRLLVKGKKGRYPISGEDSPVKASITFGNADSALDGLCSESDFAFPNCQFSGSGRTLKCKSK